MRQDLRNISYSFRKDKEDRDLIYKIDVLLYNEIENYFVDGHKDINKAYYELLEDREGIITNVISSLNENVITDDFKLFYLVDNEFMKQLNKCKRYYIALDKAKDKDKNTELGKMLEEHFNYCFDTMKQKRPIDTILLLMGSSDFRKGTIEDLRINVLEYQDFDKVFDKVLNEFKKHHKYDVEEQADPSEEKLCFGWKLYFITKAIEGLFKL